MFCLKWRHFWCTQQFQRAQQVHKVQQLQPVVLHFLYKKTLAASAVLQQKQPQPGPKTPRISWSTQEIKLQLSSEAPVCWFVFCFQKYHLRKQEFQSSKNCSSCLDKLLSFAWLWCLQKKLCKNMCVWGCCIHISSTYIIYIWIFQQMSETKPIQVESKKPSVPTKFHAIFSTSMIDFKQNLLLQTRNPPGGFWIGCQVSGLFLSRP